MKILLVEDNADLAANICEFLEQADWIVDWAANASRAWELLGTNSYDTLVLDIMLPGRMDGLDLARDLRNKQYDGTPILMLTARDSLDDKLAGFEAGTDDYLVKPFSLLELQARLNALSQRGVRSTGSLTTGPLSLDPETLEVYLAGEQLSLTPICRRLLAVLMQDAPHVVSRTKLTRTLWGDNPPNSDALRTHIHALRHCLQQSPDAPQLVTVPTIGYRLTLGQEEQA